MTKQYVKIEINELAELIKSDILLKHFYKKGLEEWKDYDEALAHKTILLKYEIENRLEKYEE